MHLDSICYMHSKIPIYLILWLDESLYKCTDVGKPNCVCCILQRGSKTPLIWLPQNWTCAGLSNILDYTSAPILTQVHTDNLLLLLLHLNCPTNQRSLPFGYVFRIFLSGCISINHLHNTDHLNYLCCCNVHHFWGHFTLSLCTIQIGTSVSLYKTVDNPVSCVAIITLQLVTFKPPNSLKFLRNCYYYVFPLARSILFIHFWICGQPHALSESQTAKQKIMGTLCILEVIDDETSVLGNIFLESWSRFPRFQLGGLKIFYYVIAHSVFSGMTSRDGNYTARYEVPTVPHLLGRQQSCLTICSHHFSVFCHFRQNPIVESSSRGHVHISYSYGYGVDTQWEWLHCTPGRTIGMMVRKI